MYFKYIVHENLFVKISCGHCLNSSVLITIFWENTHCNSHRLCDSHVNRQWIVMHVPHVVHVHVTVTWDCFINKKIAGVHTCVCPPVLSCTVLRDMDPLTGKHWNIPPMELHRPIANSSYRKESSFVFRLVLSND